MTDSATIAKGLTEAQRKAVKYLSKKGDQGWWNDPYYHDFDGRAASALVRKGCAEKRLGVRDPMYRVTGLGRAVAAELEE